jgi:hypothetical protein
MLSSLSLIYIPSPPALIFTIYAHFRGIGVAEGYDSDLIWGLF